MNRQVVLIAVLDANVLYPAPLRDYLLHLAELELYRPKWTDYIQEEWIDNLLKNRKDLKRKDLQKTQKAMDRAFPDANIAYYQKGINSLSLPDPDDRPILAAAISAKAQVIVTANVKDFPAAKLQDYAVVARHPDKFVLNLIDIDQERAVIALENQVKRLQNPPMPIERVLENLARCGLTKSVARLRTIIPYRSTKQAATDK
ncbi:PIN domain-containing protein [Compostibacter hankyongensis]|uniref:PIN domain-containing protein n=1 Tax=Compostibacter hankyongensis TaxID=1007089 RepID=A0ABP8FK12_9BACT